MCEPSGGVGRARPIRFDKCRDESCGSYAAVVFDEAATSDEEAESYAQPGDVGGAIRAVRQLTALFDVQTCGCSAALKGALC